MSRLPPTGPQRLAYVGVCGHIVWCNAKGVGEREILETYSNSASKNTSETDIFPYGPKYLLTSVINGREFKILFRSAIFPPTFHCDVLSNTCSTKPCWWRSSCTRFGLLKIVFKYSSCDYQLFSLLNGIPKIFVQHHYIFQNIISSHLRQK
jgi:hypothetical protein